jgi:hypothetical protein
MANFFGQTSARTSPLQASEAEEKQFLEALEDGLDPMQEPGVELQAFGIPAMISDHFKEEYLRLLREIRDAGV